MIFSVLISSFLLPDEEKGNIKEPLSFINPSGVQIGIGSLAFSYACQYVPSFLTVKPLCRQNVLLNFHSMKKKSLRVFQQCFLDVQTFAVLMTLLIGLTYISLREKSTANIFAAFPEDNVLIIACRIFYVVDLVFTFPLELFVIRNTLETAFYLDRPYSRLRHTILTGAIIFVVCVISLITCNVGQIIDIFGGISASFLAFIIPSACLIKITHERQRAGGTGMRVWSKIAHGILISAGFLMIVLTVYGGFTAETEEKSCNW